MTSVLVNHGSCVLTVRDDEEDHCYMILYLVVEGCPTVLWC